MALASPFDLLADFPGWVTSFEPLSRQEMTRVAGGRTFVKNMGPTLWTLAARSKLLRPNAVDAWRAKLEAMENGLATFIGYSLSRKYPIAYPNGSWSGGSFSATLHTIGSARKSIRVQSLPSAFKVSVGDLLQIGTTDLHRAVEAATASGGTTPEFEVRPHIWPGVETGAAVTVVRPACVMAIVPGSVSTTTELNGMGTVSFQGIEAR